jgi:phenylalanyl-tRNA synthetase beta chain
MLVPTRWLRTYCDPPLDTAALAARLTLTGTKDERSFAHGAPSPDHYVVGLVRSVAQHPNADRLQVCEVDVGEKQPVTIVCGAPNVAAGQSVAVARPGAKLADGRTLTVAKLRGIESNGMILSEEELALGGDHSGILVLTDAPPPGTPLSDVFPLGSDVIEFEITPNRPDCLGIYGIAREVHASTGAPLAAAPWAQDAGSFEGTSGGVAVTIDCPELCPRFTARAFEGLTIGPSPLWLKARLVAAGMRPISNVVDITNYVMLISGQPLHAFDLDQIAGGELTVRRGKPGEQVRTLDGQTRTADEDLVLICDADGPTSIAAIMGGERSEVSASTTRVLLEAATWNGANIQRSALRLGLRSEASARFEKGLSPGQTLEALALATGLLIDLCGATALPGTIDVGGPGPAPTPIVLRPERVNALLGTDIAAERCSEILRSLEFEVAPASERPDVHLSGAGANPLVVTVPHFRANDVTREVDLIEEVARIDGLDRLPATLPPRNGATGRLTPAQQLRRGAEDALASRGLSEIVGWSFTDPALLDRLRYPPDYPLRQVVTIENPLSQALSIMRPTLLGSLLDAARLNFARGASGVRLFESGTVYRAAEKLADEHHGLGVLISGPGPERWRGEPDVADFYASKGLLEAVLGVAGVELSLVGEDFPWLHPGRGAIVMANDTRIGLIGEVHPQVTTAWDLPLASIWMINIDLLATLAPQVSHYVQFSGFPALREDLAVVLPERVSAAAAIAAIRTAAGPQLASVAVFDVYRDEQIGAGNVSLAFHLEFQSSERTLSGEDVGTARKAIEHALIDLGGMLRA